MIGSAAVVIMRAEQLDVANSEIAVRLTALTEEVATIEGNPDGADAETFCPPERERDKTRNPASKNPAMIPVFLFILNKL